MAFYSDYKLADYFAVIGLDEELIPIQDDGKSLS